MPSFSRQSGTTTAAHRDEPTLVDGAAVPAGAEDPTIANRPVGGPDTADRYPTSDRTIDDRAVPDRTGTDRTLVDRPGAHSEAARTDRGLPPAHYAPADRGATAVPPYRPEAEPAPDRVDAGPKPRASLLATLGLITGVAAALLVLSGPLAGYGVGLAGLALILSVAGIRATRRRHVAGKTDALIGTILALAAIAVGVLALTGSLHWLGTDVESATRVRNWLDARFVNRF